jgi:hypothetical protein
MAKGTTAGDLSVGSVQFSKPHQTLLSWSLIVRYAAISAINLAILLVGIVLGIILAPHIEQTAIASGSAQKTVSPDPGRVMAPQSPQSPSCVSSATVECVTPIMTVGSAGIGKLLSNQIATEQLSVNGYDILKLDTNLLAAMVASHVITPAQAQALAEASRAEKLLRFQPSTPTPTAPAK